MMSARAEESENGGEREPNHVMLEAMRKIEIIHQGMEPKKTQETPDYLREGREGAMYGYGADK
jgi:hypothetical protein